jgi:ribosome-binding ATPase YchF (GTP1/OBG family)
MEKDFNKKVAQLATALAGVKIMPYHIEKAMRDMKIDEKLLNDWTSEEKRNFAHRCRVWSKPILIAANKCDLPSGEKNVKRMKEAFPNIHIVPCSAASELSLRKATKAGILKYYPGWNHFEILGTLNEKQKAGLETIQHNVLEKFGSTGVQECLDTAIFKLLEYFPVFPGGTKGLADSQGRVIPDCFLMPKDSTALDFAYTLHTDMGDGFIRGIDVKTKQVIGKEHKLKYGDVIELVFNKH